MVAADGPAGSARAAAVISLRANVAPLRPIAVADADAFCPNCGHPLRGPPRPLFQHPCFDDEQRAIVTGGRTICPSWGQWQLLSALRREFGRFVHRDRLFNVVSHRTEDAGPKSLSVCIFKLRNALDDTPFVIESRYNQGYRLTWSEEVEARGDTKVRKARRW